MGAVISNFHRPTEWEPRLSGDIARNPRESGSFAMLGKDAWVAGVPAAPSDVDDFLTDAGYFLMILGHQSRYDLF